LHEVDQLISKAYLQLLMIVLKLGMPVSINTLVKLSYRVKSLFVIDYINSSKCQPKYRHKWTILCNF